MQWPDVVALVLVVLVVVGAVAVIVHDWHAGRNVKPPETLGKTGKRMPPTR